MNLASYMDSTNLKPEATASDIRNLCLEAARLQMAAVCIQPFRLSLARQILSGSGIRRCTVIGFPLGADGIKTKLFMASEALENGADELDMVINIGAFKDGALDLVEEEIRAVLALKKHQDFILKVIVETALMDQNELINLTKLVGHSGADFIKTSTGFSSRGVSLEDIKTMKGCCPPHLHIKASGGIKTLDQALQLIAAGADRLGCSSAASIVEEYRVREGR